MSATNGTADAEEESPFGVALRTLPSSESTPSRGARQSMSSRLLPGSGDCEREVEDAESLLGMLEFESVSAEGGEWS